MACRLPHFIQWLSLVRRCTVCSKQIGGKCNVVLTDLEGIEETNGGLVVFGGGLPIYQGKYLIGGIGVSGGTVAQDEEVSAGGVLAAGFSMTQGK